MVAQGKVGSSGVDEFLVFNVDQQGVGLRNLHLAAVEILLLLKMPIDKVVY